MNKSQLLTFLEKIGAAPLKRLSQNFLIDSGVIQRLVKLAAIEPGDKVLEIGPGAGAITEELLKMGAHVMAVEKDRLFAQHLPQHPHLEVHCADILEFPLEKKPWKVVSNLPFHITAPILGKIIPLFQSFTLVVQKEVVDRISGKEPSSLTIFLQFYTTFHSSFPVPASCFYPKPGVDSAVVRLNACTPPDIDPEVLFPIVRKAFQQRRKMLSSSLRNLGNIAGILESLDISSKARPEELSLDEWVKFAKKISALAKP